MDEKVKAEELTRAYNKLCNTHEGKLVIVDILEYCDLFSTGGSDSNNLWMREGQKDVARFLIARMQEARYDNYPNILMEYARQAYEESLKEQNDGRRNEK